MTHGGLAFGNSHHLPHGGTLIRRFKTIGTYLSIVKINIKIRPTRVPAYSFVSFCILGSTVNPLGTSNLEATGKVEGANAIASSP
jgi:hypothetical protein